VLKLWLKIALATFGYFFGEWNSDLCNAEFCDYRPSEATFNFYRSDNEEYHTAEIRIMEAGVTAKWKRLTGAIYPTYDTRSQEVQRWTRVGWR
jgi:hypothetical protein